MTGRRPPQARWPYDITLAFSSRFDEIESVVGVKKRDCLAIYLLAGVRESRAERPTPYRKVDARRFIIVRCREVEVEDGFRGGE